ncbi:MAG: CDP-diacylglycerol--glycerol-3-phosphate 3-phosphatidyltransferase [Endomicrobia bacterium]|nr:CDP-diacylglycerol--glycerol-3-phosphate 3-phosphatidyltransferase [Endomicrobiia bacterium]MCX7941179.1 CDP-diacylglycerol--glycerol-3-phosphate 3-phosphatidyltransferase [Endomicrobiia bacterium]MDW8056211.1 CDP-diacylglycerol--glycerol-3-phosphate 3-phosphatidyltransferase [Elusimicrobiota bacterium]
MNLATKITIFRIFLVPLFLIFILIESFQTRVLAFLIFILGGVTDTIDGIIARKQNTVTKVGSSIDPLADKLLITTALISFLGFQELKIPTWTVIVIVIRDYLITWMRSLEYNFSMPADKTAKIKTFLQNIVVICIMVILIFKKQIIKIDLDKYIINFFPRFAMILVAIFTLVSGIVYIIKYRELIIRQFEK